MLMTRQAMLLVGYETDRLPLAADEALLEKVRLGGDRLIPVARAGFAGQERGTAGGRPGLTIVSYPPEAFLGAVLHHTSCRCWAIDIAFRSPARLRWCRRWPNLRLPVSGWRGCQRRWRRRISPPGAWKT